MASGVNNQYWNGVDYDPDQIRPGQPRHEDKEDGAMLFQLHLVYRCQRDRISYNPNHGESNGKSDGGTWRRQRRAICAIMHRLMERLL